MITEYGKTIEERKENKILLIEEFHKENGRLPKQTEKYKDVALGTFLNSISSGYTHITEEQLQRLSSLGFVKQAREAEKERKIKLVEKFFQENGRLPKKGEIYQQVVLEKFLYNIKLGGIHITETQMNRLLVLGFDRSVRDKEKEKERKIKLVEEFYEEYGRFPKVKEQYHGEALGVFLRDIRAEKMRLTKEQLERLIALGFVKQVREESKKEKIELIKKFYRINRRLPKLTEQYFGVNIGTFLYSIRQGSTQITEEQMDSLLKIGFEGQVNDVIVERKIKQVEDFYKENGRLPSQNERVGKKKIGEILLQVRIGKIRITESQFLRLQQMDATLTREQVRFFEKPKTLIKN